MSLLRRARPGAGWDAEGTAPHQSLADPAPPVVLAPRLLRLVARVALWSLVGVGAVHALLPASARVAAPANTDDRAVAVAAAFLREYLTAGDGLAGWRSRLQPFVAAGADLGGEPHPASGSSQYADQVLPAGTRSVDDGLEVTLLAHVVEVRDGQYRDGRMAAYVVTVRVTGDGATVGGPPRTAALPLAPTRTSP